MPSRTPNHRRQRTPITALVATCAAAGGVALVLACGAADASPPQARQAASTAAVAEGGDGGPVVVELFTSQGCSSCPPADRLLSELAASPDLAGRVLPLSFHVDYWDHIGWKDPYSSAHWSERQRTYAELLDGRVYTPEVVVGGSTGMVGSRRGEVLAAVRQALAAEPAARVSVEVGEPAGGRLPVTASARLLAAADGRCELWVALWQDELVTDVRRGENGGRTLRNDRVVRRLVRAAELAGSTGTETSARLELEIDPSWPRTNLGVVAFVQEAEGKAIRGAAGAKLATN
jgi:hypothetical protein